MRSEDMEQALNQLFVNYSYSFEDKNKSLALSWNQISELSKDNLCTIGSHTLTHGVLPNMSVRQVEAELRDSKLILEQHVSKSIDHFAYPYGAWNESVLNLVRKVSYKTAVLANGGMTRKGDDVIRLKRYSLF